MAPSKIIESDTCEEEGQRFLAEYQNPIIPGFAPDPSVVYVNGTFFLVTSSFHLYPGIPIYASKDLQKWTHIGNAVTRKSQVDLTLTLTKAVPLDDGHTMIGAGGLFAPTIRHHNGVFYIICTNVACEGAEFAASNFYITTTDIWAGQWSDPVNVDLHGIDPSLFFDTDGRAYIQGSWRLPRTEQPNTTIKQWEIDLSTGERIGEPREIWHGHSRNYTEGPHIYKKDDWYYLLVAEGGTFEHHHLSIARARDIWGPYESCPSNPILTGKGKDELVQDVGHGELFQDADGLWWAAVLGVRKYGDGTRYPLGRESFLTAVEWPEGQWPEIQHPRENFRRVLPGPRAKATSFAYGARVADCYIRSPALEDYQFGEEGQVRVRSSATNLTVPVGTATFVGQRQRRLNGASATATVCLEGINHSVRTGLAVYKDDFRHAAISIESSLVVLTLRNNTSEDVRVARSVIDSSAKSLIFSISATPKEYEFAYRVNSGNWKVLGRIDTAEMTARDFTGTILGIFATHQGQGSEGSQWVSYTGLHIDP
ncbi:hypothetical protein ACHAQA_007897 [Verticillium albo-atrum]